MYITDDKKIKFNTDWKAVFKVNENNNTYTMPENKEEIKRNLVIFNDVCNRIFNGQKELFYTEEEIENLKNNKELQKERNIEFI